LVVVEVQFLQIYKLAKFRWNWPWKRGEMGHKRVATRLLPITNLSARYRRGGVSASSKAGQVVLEPTLEKRGGNDILTGWRCRHDMKVGLKNDSK
jgi:hypothetical protein